MRFVRALLVSAATASGLAFAAQPPGDEKERIAWEEKLRQLEPRNKSERIRLAENRRLVDLLCQAEKMDLYRLDPRTPEGKAPDKEFHGYGVLAHVTVDRASDRAGLILSLGREMHWADGLLALCFSPRHGLRVVVGKEEVDLVICFECSRMDVYRNGKMAEYFPLVGRKWEPADKLLGVTGKAEAP